VRRGWDGWSERHDRGLAGGRRPAAGGPVGTEIRSLAWPGSSPTRSVVLVFWLPAYFKSARFSLEMIGLLV
jgi:hypothetical protein